MRIVSCSGSTIAFFRAVRVIGRSPLSSVQRRVYGTTSAGPVIDYASPHLEKTSAIAASFRCAAPTISN